MPLLISKFFFVFCLILQFLGMFEVSFLGISLVESFNVFPFFRFPDACQFRTGVKNAHHCQKEGHTRIYSQPILVPLVAHRSGQVKHGQVRSGQELRFPWFSFGIQGFRDSVEDKVWNIIAVSPRPLTLGSWLVGGVEDGAEHGFSSTMKSGSGGCKKPSCEKRFRKEGRWE